MLKIEDVSKVVENGKKTIIEGISFGIKEKEFVGILGPSGAGKTMTMRCINGLTVPTSGQVTLTSNKSGNSYNLVGSKKRELRKAREKLGVIFQGFNLVKRASAIENVMMGRLGQISVLRSLTLGFTDEEAQEALELLNLVKIADLAYRKVGSLSGGEMQRVAIARALFQNPSVLLADEPIANLDPSNAESIMRLLKRLSSRFPIVGVFHQPEMTAKYCTRVIAIKAGKIVYDGSPNLTPEALEYIYEEELEGMDIQIESYLNAPEQELV